MPLRVIFNLTVKKPFKFHLISARNPRKFLSVSTQAQRWTRQNFCSDSAATQPQLKTNDSLEVSTRDQNFIEFHGKWPKTEKDKFLEDMRIVPNFLTAEEESKLFDEVEPYLKRLRYEFDHWDDAIHGFRETERKNWYPHNRLVIQRVSEIAFNGEIMPYIHVLDLAADGVIKPHVDSSRYCGNTISGLSLLSDCVMRLVRTDENKYRQDPDENHETSDGSSYRTQPLDSPGAAAGRDENNFYADILLKRCSLYIMRHSARYNFTHEILAKDTSQFSGAPVQKMRRISIICRNEPE